MRKLDNGEEPGEYSRAGHFHEPPYMPKQRKRLYFEEDSEEDTPGDSSSKIRPPVIYQQPSLTYRTFPDPSELLRPATTVEAPEDSFFIQNKDACSPTQVEVFSNEEDNSQPEKEPEGDED